MKTNRQYNQIIDLEYFFHQDSGSDSHKLHQRDRDMLLQNQHQLGHIQEPNRYDLLRLWLQERIKTDFSGSGKRSPGEIFQDSHLLAKNLSVLKGLLVGIIGGFSFFTYSGTTPVNVFQFLLLFVFSQLALITVLLVLILLRFLMPGLKLPSFYTLLFRGMLDRIVSFFHKRWLRDMTGKQRAGIKHSFGIVKSRSSIYGSLFYWPLFGLSQIFGVGFNVGLLAVTLLKISTSDLAFGWQSTLQVSSTFLYQAVKLAALPWSWFVSAANSYPSLVEIEGSRIILKEGIYHLATQDLVAWWPFLVFCLLFYGLFFRIVLLFFGKWMEHRRLERLNFDTPPCLAVTRRMLTPMVSTQAEPETTIEETGDTPGPRERKTVSPVSHLQQQVVLVPDDIFMLYPSEKLGPLLHTRGFKISETHRFMVGYDEDQQLKKLLAERKWRAEEGLFMLLEAWMPPLVDLLSYLKELRETMPAETIIHLGLVGRPDTTAVTRVAPQDFTIWRQKVEAIGDPYINIFSLIS